MHDRRTWTEEYHRVFKLAENYRDQKEPVKEIETWIQAHQLKNDYWPVVLMAWALIGLEQYRLALRTFKFAKNVLETSNDQELQQKERSVNLEKIKEYEEKCSETDPIKRGMKCAKKYWDLCDQINKFSRSKDYDKCSEVCE